ncbi:MAG: cell division protein FtsX [Geminicoccaceae bacterium]
MSLRDLDLPLDQSTPGRFLIWIVAGLTYVLVLAFALAAGADSALHRFEQTARMVTVALPAVPGDPAIEQRNLDRAMALLRQSEGIERVEPVADANLRELVTGVLGEGESLEGLALPRLIDVVLARGANPDLEALERSLKTIAEDASLRQEPTVGDEQLNLAAYLRLIGGIMAAAMLIAIFAVVIVMTRMNVDLHDDKVDLLRHMGARDGYVARQFERHTMLQGMRGAFTGFAAAVLTILGLVHLGGAAVTSRWVPLHFQMIDWIMLACLPIGAAVLLTIAARVTAQVLLARYR